MNFSRLLTIFLVFFLFSVPVITAQDEDYGAKISNLINKSNTKELAQYFNSTIQLVLPGDEGRYSRVQAEFIIKDFFNNYPPKSFNINHQGLSSDGSEYYIGDYKSGKKTFRTYFLVKKINDQKLIHQLRFEEDK